MRLIPFSDFQKKYKQKRRAWDKYRRAFFGLSFGARDFHLTTEDIPEYHYSGGVGGAGGGADMNLSLIHI